MSTTLIEDMNTCLHILKCQGIPQEFIIATIDRAIKELTPSLSRIHSCDIPGCMSCGNPGSGDYDWYPYEDTL